MVFTGMDIGREQWLFKFFDIFFFFFVTTPFTRILFKYKCLYFSLRIILHRRVVVFSVDEFEHRHILYDE